MSAFPQVFGRYVVLDELATGGMAKLYRAKPIDGLRRVVALKRLGEGLDEAFKSMFIDEARIAAQLVHPNIVQTYELGREGDRLFIAMELVWGKTIAELLTAARESGTPIDYRIACSIVMRAAEGLDFAHRATGLNGQPLNLIHRDINPANIMVTYDGEVKLIDFGIAKADARLHLTTPGVIKGKLRYMAPEQIRSSEVDARADIFGLGLVLYELLTGQRAFDGSNPVIIFDRILNSEPENLPADVPIGLRSIVKRAMAKLPQHRYSTAGQFAEALAPFLLRDRSVTDAKETAAVMASIFPDARADMDARQKRYSEIQAVSYELPKTVIAVTPFLLEAPKTIIDDPRKYMTPVTLPQRRSPYTEMVETHPAPTIVMKAVAPIKTVIADTMRPQAALTRDVMIARRGERFERRQGDRRSRDRRNRGQRLMIRTLVVLAVLSAFVWSSFLAYQFGRARGAAPVAAGSATPVTQLSSLRTNAKQLQVED